MKIALVHDELVRRGGAEQVTLLMHKAFPNAPIYTSCYNPKNTYDDYNSCDVRTSWLSYFVRNEKMLKRFFFPFSIWAMKKIDLSEYDVVFISTTTCAKYVKTNQKNLFVAFCHYPFRLAFFPESYREVVESKGVKKWLYNTVVKKLRSIDYKAAQKIQWFITNTPHIKEIIKNSYNTNNEVTVIPASIQCKNFFVAEKPTEDYYLVVSRFEAYKKVDMVIEAFNEMPDRKLIIVGKGSQKEICENMAKNNIQIKDSLSSAEIADLYANCKALIFPQQEDYGLTPIEANASGRPVIAYGKGGVTYTTIPFKGDSKTATAFFFENQTKEDLINAIKTTEKLNFDPQFIRKHAEQYDEDRFIESVREYVTNKYKEKFGIKE
ncbi:MAG: glycosyltransferase [Bacteroidales bacterium]|nr:glycosyltransferase [Bacteroidales bacterium]